MDEAKLQNYIAAETAETDNFMYDDLFDDKQMDDIIDCDWNMVTTIYKWTVAKCFDLRIRFDECPYDWYQWTCMYLDDKEVYSWRWMASPVFLNSILIECICDVDEEPFTIDDTL